MKPQRNVLEEMEWCISSAVFRLQRGFHSVLTGVVHYCCIIFNYFTVTESSYNRSRIFDSRKAAKLSKVMKAIQLKSAADAIAKKLAILVCLPKTLFKTWLRIQLNIVFFPFRLVPAVIRITSRENGSQQVDRSTASDEHYSESEGARSSVLTKPLEPRSEDVVKQVKRLRNCVAMSIDHFTGRDFFWDMPILEQKIKRYTEALRQGDAVEIAAAKKAVKGHPVYHPKPKSRDEYNRLMEEARRGAEHVADTVPKSIETVKPVTKMTPLHHDAGRNFGNGISVTNKSASNVLKPKEKVVFLIDNEETFNTKQEVRITECQRNKRENIKPVMNMTPLHHDAGRKLCNGTIVTNESVSNVLKPKKKVVFLIDNEETFNTKQELRITECQRNKRLSLQNKRLRSQLMTTNNRLEDLLKSSNSLLQEVSKLNGHFSKLTNMNTKITTLENEIGEGKKLLYELEEERNDLRHKLLALEQLIKEEESYLDDLSCESGYEEIENVCDSHDEL